MSNDIKNTYKFAILNNLLNQKFSKKLLKLEKNCDYHFNVINETKTIVNNITEICEELIEKIPKFKRNSVVVNNNIENNISNNYRSSSINKSEKTPTKNLTSKSLTKTSLNNNNNKSKIINTNSNSNKNNNNSDLTKSKSNLNLLKGRTTEKPANFVSNNSKNNNNNRTFSNNLKTLNKTKSSMNLKNIKIKKDMNNTTSNIKTDFSKDFDSNNNPINTSKNYIKRSKTGARFSLLVPNKLKLNINSISNNNNNNNNLQTSPNKTRKSSKNIKKSLTSRKRRYTIQNKDNTLKTLNKISNDYNNNSNNANENNSHNLNEKNRSFNSEEISKFDMESNLIKSQDIFDNNDPLLISPITDNDFIPTDLILNVKEIENNNKPFLSEKFKEDFYYQFENFLKFLNNKEIFSLFYTNKKIKEISMKFLIKKLTNEKKFYINKIKNIIEKNKMNENNILMMRKSSNIELSKGTKKAITLLNEPVINRLFNEVNKIPNSDILLVYKIFFQLIQYKNIINQPFFNFNENYNENEKENENNKKIFWEKTCNFFAIENNGKTGDLIEKIVNQNKLILDNKNLYKIIHIINGNIGKIIPSYFTKTCGTTGLVVFFIKDILDYTGISNDKKFWENAYVTYKGMVNVIEENIEMLKKYN